MASASLYSTAATHIPHHAGNGRSVAPRASTQSLKRLLCRLLLCSAAGAAGSLVAIIGLLFLGGILSF